MKKTAKHNGRKKDDWYFVDKLYRYLPFFLIVFALGNCYFVIKYVNRQKVGFDDIRSRAIHDVSNAFAFVESTLTNEINVVRLALSNEVRRVRFSNDMRLRRLPIKDEPESKQETENPVSSLHLEKPRNETTAFNALKSNVRARYFRIGGSPRLDLGNGFYVGVGDDIGFGVIDSIYPTGVRCDGVFYPLSSPHQKEVVKNELP